MRAATFEAELWSPQRATLGECPRWDRERGRLLWVDIAAGRALGTDERSTEVLLELQGRASAIAQRAGGGFLVAAETELVLVDGRGALERRAVEEPGSERCLNDGACDGLGRLWIGSVVEPGQAARGRLFRVDRDTTPLLGGLSESNGLGWSPDARRLYLVDSGLRRIDAIDFDLDAGTLGTRREFARFAEPELPDGLTVDADGCVWVAIWGGSEVRRLDPQGQVAGRVRLPVSRPSSCTFGGSQMRDLYVTSARLGLDDLSAEPLAGSIFCVPDAGDGQPAPLARI